MAIWLFFFVKLGHFCNFCLNITNIAYIELEINSCLGETKCKVEAEEPGKDFSSTIYFKNKSKSGSLAGSSQQSM